MGTYRIDLDRARADLAFKEALKTDAHKAVQEALAYEDQVKAEYADALAHIQAILPYVDIEFGDEIEQLPRPGADAVLAGYSGMAAAKRYAAMNPGAEMKLTAIYAAMQKLGFTGTINSLYVAFPLLARSGAVLNPSRGVYRFPAAEPVDDPFGGMDDGRYDLDDEPDEVALEVERDRAIEDAHIADLGQNGGLDLFADPHEGVG